MKRKSPKKIAASDVLGIPIDFQLTNEFSNAFDLMENTRRHIYITGRAGTGKSTLLNYFKENTKKNTVVVAPTGIAAINVSGSTIHSFFRFPPRLISKSDIKKIRKKEKLFAAIDTVIIDEVSMVRADVMDGIDFSLRINRNCLNEPFGGVQLILIGDPFQLEPVVEKELKDHFSVLYESPFFFSSNIIKQIKLVRIELQKIFRQNDTEFIELLNRIRNKTIQPSDLARLNRRYTPNVTMNSRELAIILSSTNNIAYQINNARLNALHKKEYSYLAAIEGDFDEDSFPTEKILKLKEGVQVMMVKNDPNKQWVNGSLGIVQKLSDDNIEVIVNNTVCTVEPTIWEKVQYDYDRNDEKIVPRQTGTFRQYPIKLAWAITIHKSQGKTFDRIIIDLGNGAFAHGQTYVALSRARTLEGIILKRTIRPSDVILNECVLDFC